MFAGEGDPILDAFREGLKGVDPPPYKNPMDEKYFGKSPPVWASCAWTGEDYLNSNGQIVSPSTLATKRKKFYASMGIDVQPGAGLLEDYCDLAAVGAKGCAKSFTFGMAAIDKIQKFPGIKFGIVANSYSQAFGSGGEKLVKVALAMGIDFNFREEMMIDGVKHYNVYYFPEFDAKCCILSFENIKMIEGTEWDGFWFEEIQDCSEKGVATAMSRTRRGFPPFHWFAGMPDDENHWMYSFFSEAGIPLFEPPLKENIQNVPPTYIANLRRIYRGQDAERYIEGKRVAINKQKVIPNMRWDIHVTSELSSRLCVYDPYRSLYVVFDFNVAPMCVYVCQIKEWDFVHGGSTKRKPIMCQVGEFEMWNATTAAMMDLVMDKYGSHPGDAEIFGDATGNKRDTRSPGLTDWKIIKSKVKEAGLRGRWHVREGLIANRKPATTKVKRGEARITYSNPPKRDTITILNNLMIDGDGDPGILFLPESLYPSGGAANAVASAKSTMESKIDPSNDKLDNSGANAKVPRTHFLDDVLYAAWRVNGGKLTTQPEKVRSKIGEIMMGKGMNFSTSRPVVVTQGFGESAERERLTRMR